jgi:hypothetical protein
MKQLHIEHLSYFYFYPKMDTDGDASRTHRTSNILTGTQWEILKVGYRLDDFG